jgi:hypothetical protein
MGNIRSGSGRRANNKKLAWGHPNDDAKNCTARARMIQRRQNPEHCFLKGIGARGVSSPLRLPVGLTNEMTSVINTTVATSRSVGKIDRFR